jgi:hypothetical protein
MGNELLIGGIILGAAVVGIIFMSKRKEEYEDTGFNVQAEGGTRRRRSRSRRSRRVKI